MSGLATPHRYVPQWWVALLAPPARPAPQSQLASTIRPTATGDNSSASKCALVGAPKVRTCEPGVQLKHPGRAAMWLRCTYRETAENKISISVKIAIPEGDGTKRLKPVGHRDKRERKQANKGTDTDANVNATNGPHSQHRHTTHKNLKREGQTPHRSTRQT